MLSAMQNRNVHVEKIPYSHTCKNVFNSFISVLFNLTLFKENLNVYV